MTGAVALRTMRGVIRNAVIHIMNEQPLLADLFEPPGASDVGLLCTNLRTMDGRRPVFVDSSDATFFFPYLHIRFLEIPRASLARSGEEPATPTTDLAVADAVTAGVGANAADDDLDLEIDEDFLRRIREV